MIDFIVLVLAIALFLYAFLAGADFGAGILEITPFGLPRKERSSVIGKAMGPVWEANHIWLILALVITFNAFPVIFWFLSEWFHFPLGALAIGIIFRGASFTFLHYDPIIDKSQRVYHWIFGLSSLWCTMCLGVIIGSLMLGDFSPNDMGIYERYFAHWLNPFCFSMGVFMTLLMVFNASLFLLMESKTNRSQWRNLTLKVFALLVISGMIAHGIFILTNPTRWKIFFYNIPSLIFVTVSFLLLFPQLYTIRRNFKNRSRIIAGMQLFCIMCAGFAPLYPKIILFRDLNYYTFNQTAAEAEVLKYLCWALIFGLLFILPGYWYLMKIFKTQKD
ncbi:cytochrome d ubiquinol oxidase subunit II [Peredibacter sp. HCB2-198]|uniref:cytochrome d ubiquinol oxidase subunit II n=1 Tax=Peredibacter sp. HCB2-198 TaxID=3383025 RepID=UPI0038B5CBF6